MRRERMIFLLNWMLKAFTFIGRTDTRLEVEIEYLLEEIKNEK